MKKEERDNIIKNTLRNVNYILRHFGLSISDTISERIDSKTLDIEAIDEDLQDYINETFQKELNADARFHYLRINDMILPVMQISTWQKETKYSFKNNRNEYRIVINRTENSKIPLANTILVFETSEAQEKAFKEISDYKVFGARSILLKNGK